MRLRNLALTGALAAFTAFAPCLAVAQDKYPERPIELVVSWGPGGGADQLARLVSSLLEPAIGQSVPVVNVPGGTGATGMAKILAAPADGYSMAIYIADSHALLAGTEARWSMDDITPVAVLIQAPSFIFVAKDSPYQSWTDFEAAAKKEPGKLKVATLGFGSVDDFTLKHVGGKGVEVVQVPFSKPSERYISILGGHADALYEQAGDVRQFLDSGEMKPVMVFGNERFAAFPDAVSSKEAGYDIALPQFRSIVVRAGTPPERVKALSDALTAVSQTPEFKKFLEDQYGSPTSFIAGEEATAFVAAQLEDMKAANAAQ